MPIDPSIPLQAQNVKLESPINQLTAVGEAMKIGEMSRGIDTQNKLRDLYSQGIDISTPEGFKQVASIDPATALKLRTDALKSQELQGNIKKTGIEIDQKTFDLVKQKMSDLAFNPSDNNIKAHLEDGILRKEVTPAQAQMTWDAVSKLNPDQRKNYFTDLGMKADERAKLYETKRHNITTEGIQGGHLQIARQDLANKYDPTIQSNLAAAKAGGETTGKAVATARINLPTVIANAEDAINVIDQMIGKPAVYKDGKLVQAGTKPHAGFQDYVGATLKPGARFIEGTNAAGYEAFQKQLEGKAFTEAFDTLRGGGSITEKEGEKATAAKLRMSKAQNEKEYMEAAREYQGIVRKGVERAKAKAAGGGAAPAGGEIDFNSLK